MTSYARIGEKKRERRRERRGVKEERRERKENMIKRALSDPEITFQNEIVFTLVASLSFLLSLLLSLSLALSRPFEDCTCAYACDRNCLKYLIFDISRGPNENPRPRSERLSARAFHARFSSGIDAIKYRSRGW